MKYSNEEIKKACEAFAEEFVEKGNYPECPTPITIKLYKPLKGRDVL